MIDFSQFRAILAHVKFTSHQHVDIKAIGISWFNFVEVPMCFRDCILTLQQHGVIVTQSQLRWAISSGKVPRPPLDGSLRFDFAATHLDELVRYFERKSRDKLERSSPSN